MKSSSAVIPFLVGCMGIACYTTMDAAMKYASLEIGAYSALLYRMWAGALLAGLVLLARHRHWPARKAMRVHIERGTVSAAMALLWFWGLARLPMAIALALSFIAPIIALYLAAVLLKEKIGPRSILAALFGFGGVIVIGAAELRAGVGGADPWGMTAILASACLYAYNIILMRRQSLLARPEEAAFFMTVIPGLWLALGAPFAAVAPPVHVWGPILFGALFAFGALILLAWAYARAEAQLLAPVEFTGFIWASLLGWLVFSEKVAWSTLAGAVLIVAGCLIAVWRPRVRPSVVRTR